MVDFLTSSSPTNDMSAHLHQSRSSSKDLSSIARVEVSDSQTHATLHKASSLGATSSESFHKSAPHSPSKSKGTHLVPGPSDDVKEKGLSKSVSTFFKSLFNSKGPERCSREHGGISDTSATHRSNKSSKSFSAGKGLTINPERSKPAPVPVSTHGQVPSSPTVHQGYHHAEMPLPLASSQSVTMRKPDTLSIPPQPPSPGPATSSAGKEEAPPSTLLAVSPVLPPKMARPVWCLKDYAIVEKMYTGYASTVYKAWCKLSGETVCLKVKRLA